MGMDMKERHVGLETMRDLYFDYHFHILVTVLLAVLQVSRVSE